MLRPISNFLLQKLNNACANIPSIPIPIIGQDLSCWIERFYVESQIILCKIADFSCRNRRFFVPLQRILKNIRYEHDYSVSKQ